MENITCINYTTIYLGIPTLREKCPNTDFDTFHTVQVCYYLCKKVHVRYALVLPYKRSSFLNEFNSRATN